MIGFVYLWYDSGRNSTSFPNRRRFCLGSHRGPENDGYVTGTGGHYFRAAYRKRPQDFRRRIIERIYEGDDRTVYVAEYRWLSLIKSEELGQRYYNLKKAALGMTREDMFRVYPADPMKGQRHSQTLKLRHATDPILK